MMNHKFAAFLLLSAGLAWGCASGSAAAQSGKTWVYVGTYTGGESKGIYLFEMDTATGALAEKGVAAEIANPSFLALHPSRKFLYAVGEIGNFGGKKTGAVSAFSIDGDSGKLTLLNQQSSEGGGPCHLVVDKEGKSVLVANYGGGSIASLPIGPDGKLGPAASAIQHKGSGSNPKRQEAPHAHSINLDPDNKFAFAADLGLDKVLVYAFDPAKSTLSPKDPPGVVAPGSGPRHFAFHPGGRFAYVINEMTCTVTAFSYDGKGVLTEIHSVPTTPDGVKPGYSTAEVQVSPDGKWLFGSNRGHDSIAVFAIDGATGRLTPVENEPTQGKTPRNFGVDPSGKWLLAANQGSDSIVVFKIDAASGKLEPAGHTVKAPKPVCVKFLPR